MPSGKYFFIVSQLNGAVLDIEAEDSGAGAHVVMWERKREEPENQLWYEDLTTGTIRSKLNNYCITNTDDGLVMEPFRDGNKAQQFVYRRAQQMFRSRGDQNQVFDILDANEDQGARVGVWEESGESNQLWQLERVQVRFFVIRSKLNPELVLDIEKENEEEGAQVVTWPESGKDNQIWYEDDEGIIRSKLNNFAMTGEEGQKVTMQQCDQGRMEQQWHRFGDQIVCRHKKHLVLDIKGKKKRKGADVVVWENSGEDNQRWTYENRY